MCVWERLGGNESRDKPTRPFISLSARLRCFLNSLSLSGSREQARLLSPHAPCAASRAAYALSLFLSRSECRLLRQPVSYVRNRSLLLVPSGVARSLRKHVHGRRVEVSECISREGVAVLPATIRYLYRTGRASERERARTGCAATFIRERK